MNKTSFLIALTFLITFNQGLNAQRSANEVDYKIIAEGNDSPIDSFKIICYNKFFNLDNLPKTFLEKYNLADKKLYKKKMLVELFVGHNEMNHDSIVINKITQENKLITIDYKTVKSSRHIHSEIAKPFMIIQLTKNRKTAVKIIENGNEFIFASDIYLK